MTLQGKLCLDKLDLLCPIKEKEVYLCKIKFH